jgi:MoaA/NifB/PqqE/SkfB family radical SAM enzyme
LWGQLSVRYLLGVFAALIESSESFDRILGDGVPLPHDLVLETTTRCNLRCLHCARSWERVRAQDMSRLVFRRVGPPLGGAGRVSLYGHGESLLHPRFLSMLRTVRNRGAPVHVVTNGTLISSDLAERLVGARLDNLVFSVDFAHPRPFAALRRGATLKHVLRGVARIAAAKRRLGSPAPLLALQMVGMRSNVAELPHLVSLGAAVGCDKVKMVALAEYGDMIGESLARNPEEAQPVRESLVLAEQLGIELEVCPSYLELLAPPAAGVPGDAESPATPAQPFVLETRMCGDPWCFTYVTSRGEVIPCCGSSRVMGDLTRQDFLSVWRGAPYREFRRRVLTGDLPEECRNCVLKPPLRLATIPRRMAVEDNDHHPVPLLWGWYDREAYGQVPFRWTGPRAGLLLHGRGARELRLRLLWPGGGEGPIGLIRLDGVEIARYAIDAVGEHTVEAACQPSGELALVEVVAENPRRPIPAEGLPDRRVLGVGVRLAELE